MTTRVLSPGAINGPLKDIRRLEEPRKVLLCRSDHFDVVDVKNPHMSAHQGGIDKTLAQQQWHHLYNSYLQLKQEGFIEEVAVLDSSAGLEDMVFTANQSFPWIKEGQKMVVLSNMRHPNRQKEVPFFSRWYQQQGYSLHTLPDTVKFEGMGDAIPHPGRQLVYGGYGFRTDRQAYDALAEVLETPVVLLELIDERFYHLDTCFLPLDEQTVLICPAAFGDDTLWAMTDLFDNVLEVPENEAAQGFALNAHCMRNEANGRRVALIQQGNTVTNGYLADAGYEVTELDTSQFMRSGGSVFCMKMMWY